MRIINVITIITSSVLDFLQYLPIIVTAICGLSYSAWIDVPGWEAMCLLVLSAMEVLEVHS